MFMCALLGTIVANMLLIELTFTTCLSLDLNRLHARFNFFLFMLVFISEMLAFRECLVLRGFALIFALFDYAPLVVVTGIAA